MRILATIIRILLGLIFVVFGLNGFLHFIPTPPMSGPAVSFFTGMAATGYMLPLMFGTQVVGGAMLLLGLYVPVALLLLAPVIVNIMALHAFLAPSGLPVAVVVAIFELFLAWENREKFAPLFR